MDPDLKESISEFLKISIDNLEIFEKTKNNDSIWRSYSHLEMIIFLSKVNLYAKGYNDNEIDVHYLHMTNGKKYNVKSLYKSELTIFRKELKKILQQIEMDKTSYNNLKFIYKIRKIRDGLIHYVKS